MIWVKEWLQILVTTHVRVLSNIYDYFTIYEWLYLCFQLYFYTQYDPKLYCHNTGCH